MITAGAPRDKTMGLGAAFDRSLTLAALRVPFVPGPAAQTQASSRELAPRSLALAARRARGMVNASRERKRAVKW